MSRTPRLIRCVLPEAANQSHQPLRIVTAGRLTSVMIRTKPLIPATPLGLQQILQTLPPRDAINMNRASPGTDVECGLIWSGGSEILYNELHRFLSAYVLTAFAPKSDARGITRSNYGMPPDHVEGFRRIVARLQIRRPFLKITINGPWPALSVAN